MWSDTLEVTEFSIKGPLLIEPKSFADDRGFFTERYRQDLFRELGIPDFIQDNYSRSSLKVLRGIHYQYDRPQGKLVTSTRGVIFDVAVDLRQDSPSLGQHVHVELSGDRPAWFWIPAGFGHGFEVLSKEGADVLYKVDAFYNSCGEGGIRWDDPELAISWPGTAPSLSPRDQELPGWRNYLADCRF